jgi:exodeoxyribonuclease VIII
MIPAKGLHAIRDSEYFAIDLPSASQTKSLIANTDAHLKWEREHPQQEENEAFALGALVHAMLLAPQSIETDFIRVGRIDRRTKDGRTEYEAVSKRAAMNGSRIVTDEQYQQAEEIADGARSCVTASGLLKLLTHREATVIGEIDGKPAKAKMDGLIIDPADNTVVVVDLKTTVSAAPTSFASSCARFHYPHQQAWYSELLESLGYEVLDFVFLAVEKTAPHLTACYRIDDFSSEVARRKLTNLCRRWWRIHDGEPVVGYPEGISTVEMPKWWMTEN